MSSFKILTFPVLECPGDGGRYKPPQNPQHFRLMNPLFNGWTIHLNGLMTTHSFLLLLYFLQGLLVNILQPSASAIFQPFLFFFITKSYLCGGNLKTRLLWRLTSLTLSDCYFLVFYIIFFLNVHCTL
jgi:hypothetical protein